MDSIDIYRSGTLFVTIDPDSSSSQSKQVMGDNKLLLSFQLNHFVDFALGDYCTVFGEVYKINDAPVVTKSSTYQYEYKLSMYAEISDLAKAQYLFLDTVNNLSESEFSLMGNAKTFVDLVVENINRVFPGWKAGEVIQTGYQNMSFSKDSCASALAKLATQFKTEFWVKDKTVYLTQLSRDRGYTFKHGRNKGLYTIQRQSVSNASIVTRLYAFGANTNLPVNYYSARLRLPGGFVPCLISQLTVEVIANTNGTSTYIFHWTNPTAPGVTAITLKYRPTGSAQPYLSSTGDFNSPRSITLETMSYDFVIQTEGGTCGSIGTLPVTVNGPISVPVLVNMPMPYIENNVNLYGVIEGTLLYDQIFPHRTGVVSSVDATNPLKFSDQAIDFDVNQQLLPGTPAKVTFNTGQLAGFSFDIHSFNNITKEFVLNLNKDNVDLTIPSISLKPAIGDEYVLVDLEMPASYITAAEQALLAQATADLLKQSTPQVSYTVAMDPVFIRSKGWQLDIGDMVWITDAELSIDRKIRVVEVTRNILVEDQYQVQLSDVVSPGTITNLINLQSSTSAGLSQLSSQLQENSILNGTVVGNLKFKNGSALIPDIKTIGSTTGYSQVYIDDVTGELVKV